jgi:hypothetical protein
VFLAREGLDGPPLIEWMTTAQEEFSARFKGSPIKRLPSHVRGGGGHSSVTSPIPLCPSIPWNVTFAPSWGAL